MKLLKNFPFWISFYITVVGLVFSTLTVVQTSLMDFKNQNKYFLTGFSLILFFLGIRYGYLSLRGKLEPKGISVNEVRKQALEKIESEAYLAKTAVNDPDPEIRQKALKRLEEIKNET